MVNMHMVEEDVEAIVYSGVSASAVGKHMALKLVNWKRARKV